MAGVGGVSAGTFVFSRAIVAMSTRAMDGGVCFVVTGEISADFSLGCGIVLTVRGMGAIGAMGSMIRAAGVAVVRAALE